MGGDGACSGGWKRYNLVQVIECEIGEFWGEGHWLRSF